MEYFKLIANHQPGGVKLLHQREMDGLNQLRVAFKHRGTLPSSSALQQTCADTRAFLEDNTPLVFGIAFGSIDMAEVIPQIDVRSKVFAATAAASVGDIRDAMGVLAEAYDQLFGPAAGWFEHPVGSFGVTVHKMPLSQIASSLAPAQSDTAERAHWQGLAALLEEVFEATRQMQRAMRVMALGIDYRQFERFAELTPAIDYYLDQRAERHERPDYAPTVDEFEYCRSFIITASLRVADRP